MKTDARFDSQEKRKIHPEGDKTVILLGEETLLSSAIEFLLLPQKNLTVIRKSFGVDPEALILDIERIDPDAVIVLQHERSRNIALLVHLIQDCPGLKVIVVNLENNVVQVYNNQQVCINDAADLWSVVEI